MYQFYVVEIIQYPSGEFGHLVHWAYDADPDIARNKGDAKYYEVLAQAALSNTLSHAAILFNTDGFPLRNDCYKHVPVPEPGPEPEPEPEPEAEA